MSAIDLIQKVKHGATTLMDNGVGEASDFVRKHPVTSAVGVGGGILAATQVVRIVRKKRKKAAKTKKSTTRRARPKRKKPLSRAKKPRSRQRKPRTAGKGKDTSTRRIRFTKNNQPYVILKSGKARFIKKSSVAQMRKRKGGKY